MRKRFVTSLLFCSMALAAFSQSKPVRPRTNLAKEISGVWALVDKPTDAVSAGGALNSSLVAIGA